MKPDTSNLTRKTTFIMVYNVFGAVAGYITLFFVLRLVGTSAWGILGAATGMVGLLTLIADFGLSGAHIKKFSEGNNIDEKMGAYILLKIIYDVLFVIISFLAIFVVTDIFGFHFETVYLREAVVIIILYYFLTYLGGIFKTTLRAYMKTTIATIPDFFRVLVQDITLICFTLWWVYHPHVTPEFVGVLYAYGYLLSVFVQLSLLILYSKNYILFKIPSLPVLKEYILFALPLGFFGAVGVVQGYTDRAMLQFFWNYKEVGAYFSIQRIVIAITTFGMAVSFVLYPAQSHHFSGGDRKKFEEITKSAERYISLLVIPLIGFGIVFAPEILNMWNRNLVSYALVLQILLIYAYFYVLNSPYGSQLVSAGRPKENLKAGIVQASLNVILNTVLIPTSILGISLFGLKSVGAAIATFTSYLFGFVLIRYKVYRILGTTYNKRVFMHIFATTVPAVILYYMNTYVLSFVRFYELLIAFLIFIGMYGGILFVLGELKKEEIKLIVNKFIYLK